MARKYRDKSLHDNILAKKMPLFKANGVFFADFTAQMEQLALGTI